MKKFFFIFFSLFFFYETVAIENISDLSWSNKKEAPTNLKEAETYIYQKYLDITPSEHRSIKPNKIVGIWYSQDVGFVGIYEDSFLSNEFRMMLIKAPFGYGLNHIYDPDEFYKSTRDHEGTTEATIIKNKFKDGKGEFFSLNKFWYENKDGTYRYDTKVGSVNFLDDTLFVNEIQSEKKKNYFFKITPRVKEIFKNIDKSKLISQFQIETRVSGMFIYFDTVINDDFIEDKFFNLNSVGDVSTGKIYRGTKEVEINGIDFITCFNKGSGDGLPYHMYYKTADYSGNEDIVNTGPKLITKRCNPFKISYSNYFHYKNRQYYWTGGIALSLIVIFFFLKIQRSQELAAHNKNHKNKFETYSEFKEYKQKIEDKESLKQSIKEEKERKAEELKLAKEAKAEEARIKAEERRLEREEKRKERVEFKEAEDDYDDSLMDKVKRLKRLYKNGTLSKSEFEKAKNKLLK